MNAKDQVKVLKAGFTIIRKEVTHVVGNMYKRKIKAKTKEQREWHTLEENFRSEFAINRRIKEMLENDSVIED